MRYLIPAVLVWLMVFGFWMTARSQELRQVMTPCVPKQSIDVAIREKRIRLVFEIVKSHRHNGVRILIYRDTDGDYTVFEELSDGMMCLLGVGRGSRLGELFG